MHFLNYLKASLEYVFFYNLYLILHVVSENNKDLLDVLVGYSLVTTTVEDGAYDQLQIILLNLDELHL